MTSENRQLNLAEAFVEETGCHIFLTGKAGTGKTTFLQNLRKKTAKRLIVTAPTGVAAINAGGVTLHSFFQLPFGPFPPGSNPFGPQNQHRMSKEKKNIIKSLDLLVIDEISMVRADLLDLVDSVLRRYRRFDAPFGGVQLLMIGDLHQLSPVVKESDWAILKPHYDSPYFFSSVALKQSELIPIELKHIYRQTDDSFIGLLNEVRDNKLTPQSLELLNSRYLPDFDTAQHKGYITLSTHNASADAINQTRLAELNGLSRRFEAELDGEFPEHTYPTASSLELKVGAQVMFVRNDFSTSKLYFNGKIGTITHMSASSIEVSCPDDPGPIEVEPVLWENIEYKLDPESSEIITNIIGTFSQYPLKLAWAITIHKSQGLTFDKAVIDAQAAFAHGQVYVALSRCRTFEGLVLSSPLNSSAIRSDHTVNRFVREAQQHEPDQTQLHTARIRFQQKLLLDCFSFAKLSNELGRLISNLKRYEGVIQILGAGDWEQMQRRTGEEICAVGENFKRQLYSMFSETVPGEDPAILDRLAKASVYFENKFDEILFPAVQTIHIDTDNKEIRKRVNNSITWLQEEVAVKLAAVRSCGSGFSPTIYLRALSTAELEAAKPKPKPVAVEYTEADVGHPELFSLLKDWRREKALEKGVQLFQVMHQKTLVQIAVHLPDTLPALKAIKGIGKKMAEQYGEELTRLVSGYRSKHNITSVSLPEAPLLQAAVQQKSRNTSGEQIDTRMTSLNMFRQGMSVEQIARERSLTSETVEKHLARSIEQGELDVQALVSDHDLNVISDTIARMDGAPLREIRQAAGPAYRYGEIFYVLAHLKRSRAEEQS